LWFEVCGLKFEVEKHVKPGIKFNLNFILISSPFFSLRPPVLCGKKTFLLVMIVV
jgi:hypothetical protein